MSALNLLSYFKCMKNVTTKPALIDAMTTATTKFKRPKWDVRDTHREDREKHQGREDEDVEAHRRDVRVDVVLPLVLLVGRDCVRG